MELKIELEIVNSEPLLDIEFCSSYYVTGPICHNRPAKIQRVIFTAPTDRRIVRLTRHCVAGPCGFSYSVGKCS